MYQVKSSLFRLSAVFFFCAGIWAPSLFGTMLGDTLTISRGFPNATTSLTQLTGSPTTVVLGNSDQVNDSIHVIINPEATTIFLDFTSSSAYIGDATTFDGYVFTGFSNTIQDVSFVSSGITISSAQTTFGDDFIQVNLASSFSPSSTIEINVEFSASVPEPSSIFLLLTGFLGLFVFKIS